MYYAICCLVLLNFGFLDGMSISDTVDNNSIVTEKNNDLLNYRNDYKATHGLPNGWIKFHPMPVPWEEARLMCHLESAVLASPLNDDLLNTLMKEVSNVSTIFTGISSTYANGVFVSVEGVPIEQIPQEARWAPGEPNNKNGEERCIAMNSDGALADVSCSQPRPYICFKEMTPDMALSNDECGTIDREYVLNKRTGHCYKFHRFGQTWSRAFQTCAAEGGYLAIINSKREADVLREIGEIVPEHEITAADTYYMFIGMRDWTKQGNWMTIEGQTLKTAGYDIWYENQPQYVDEFCGGITRRNAYIGLHDVGCEVTKPFICEKLPKIPYEVLDEDSNSDEKIDSESGKNVDSDSGKNVDSDSDKNVDSDSGKNVDSESGKNVDSDSSKNVDSDSDKNFDSDSDKNVDSDSDQNVDKNNKSAEYGHLDEDKLLNDDEQKNHDKMIELYLKNVHNEQKDLDDDLDGLQELKDFHQIMGNFQNYPWNVLMEAAHKYHDVNKNSDENNDLDDHNDINKFKYHYVDE